MYNRLIITFIIVCLVFLLSCTPLFRGSRKQKRFRAQGMCLMIRPRRKLILLAAMAVFIFLVMFFFVLAGLSDGTADWEKDVDPLIFMMVYGTVFPALLMLIDHLLYADHILYDDEKILRGRAFRGYEQIAWTELARMEVVSSERFRLYDREGRRRVSADIGFANFEDFRRMAQIHCRPDRQLMSEHETAYQQKFAVRSGRGILRRKAGEYFLIPVLFLALPVVARKQSGGSLAEAFLSWFTQSDDIIFPLLIFLPALLTLLIPILMLLQQIDYDTQEITFRRFPLRTLTLRWSEVRKVELGTYNINRQGAVLNLRVTLYYGDRKRITIYQHRFRKGFPEFEGFLQKMIEKYQIPVKAEKGSFIKNAETQKTIKTNFAETGNTRGESSMSFLRRLFGKKTEDAEQTKAPAAQEEIIRQEKTQEEPPALERREQPIQSSQEPVQESTQQPAQGPLHWKERVGRDIAGEGICFFALCTAENAFSPMLWNVLEKEIKGNDLFSRDDMIKKYKNDFYTMMSEPGIHIYRYEDGRLTDEKWIKKYNIELYNMDACELILYQEYGVTPIGEKRKTVLQESLKAEKVKNTLVYACYENDTEKILSRVEKASKTQLNKKLGVYNTPLGYCVENHNFTAFKAIAEKGADIGKRSLMGTPLQMAFYYDEEDIIFYIYENYREQFDQEVGKTDFGRKYHIKSEKIIKLLIDYGCEIDAPGAEYPPLHCFAANNNVVGLRVLLEHGADINQKDKKGQTALEIAISKGAADAKKFLEEYTT